MRGNRLPLRPPRSAVGSGAVKKSHSMKLLRDLSIQVMSIGNNRDINEEQRYIFFHTNMKSFPHIVEYNKDCNFNSSMPHTVIKNTFSKRIKA